MKNIIGRRYRAGGGNFSHVGTYVAPILAAAIFCTAPAAAQSAMDSSDEDIVVTAQKRSESINDVGLSITAASGEQLLEVRFTANRSRLIHEQDDEYERR